MVQFVQFVNKIVIRTGIDTVLIIVVSCTNCTVYTGHASDKIHLTLVTISSDVHVSDMSSDI